MSEPTPEQKCWEESEATTFVGNALRKLEKEGLIETCGKVKGKTSPRLLWRRKED